MARMKGYCKNIFKILCMPFSWVKSLKTKAKSKVVTEYPEKETWKLGTLLGAGSILFIGMVAVSSLVFSPEDTGSEYNTVYSSESDETDGDVDGVSVEKGETAVDIKGISKGRGHRLSGDDPAPKKGKQATIKYRGTQVLVRASSQGDRALPIGTNFVGKLLSQVDTRHSDKFVRVILPFGGKFRDRVGIPKNTVLLGAIAYSGHGDRVFLNFHTGVLPDGTEIKMEGTAMDSKDFSPGLIGSYHSAFGSRAGATLGFSFAAGASDVLQEREALGEGFNQTVTKKSTMKNALLNGISEFAKTEGAFQLEEARSEGAYVTLNQGKELIITLTKTFKNGESNE